MPQAACILPPDKVQAVFDTARIRHVRIAAHTGETMIGIEYEKTHFHRVIPDRAALSHRQCSLHDHARRYRRREVGTDAGPSQTRLSAHESPQRIRRGRRGNVAAARCAERGGVRTCGRRAARQNRFSGNLFRRLPNPRRRAPHHASDAGRAKMGAAAQHHHERNRNAPIRPICPSACAWKVATSARRKPIWNCR